MRVLIYFRKLVCPDIYIHPPTARASSFTSSTQLMNEFRECSSEVIAEANAAMTHIHNKVPILCEGIG